MNLVFVLFAIASNGGGSPTQASLLVFKTQETCNQAKRVNKQALEAKYINVVIECVKSEVIEK